MIRTGRKFSKPEMSRVINGDKVLPEAEEVPEKTRLDVMMAGVYKSYNRSTLQKFIRSGFVKVDGETVLKPNALFPLGVKLELAVPDEQKNADLALRTLYEDENVLVVDKPAGLLSMAKNGYCPEKTLTDYGLIVHRLDRDTSGVVILAKNPETQRMLRRQFQERTTHKTYVAVVTGRPKLDAARIDLPIARNYKRPTTFLVMPGGKESETFYRVLKASSKHSLVELKPTTGRTHQLRVHMKYLGHPIVGDVIYGEEAAPRLMLHAVELEITLPGGERRVFRAEPPEEFARMIDGESADDYSDKTGVE